jgi:hypothetical protein
MQTTRLNPGIPFAPRLSILAGALLVAGGLSFGASSAKADVVYLDFEDIGTGYPFDSGNTKILDFYNGGTSSVGTTGTNYGISFGSNALAICLNSLSVSCSNTSRGGLGDPSSQKGALFFLQGSETYLNYPAGFKDGFSFNYVSFSFNGSVNVYDNLAGTGTILATLNLTPNKGSCPGYNAGFCPFSPKGVTFAGTAKSIGFAGVANQIVFDDVTFGSEIPGPGPGPNEEVPSPLAIASLPIAFSSLRKMRNYSSRLKTFSMG